MNAPQEIRERLIEKLIKYKPPERDFIMECVTEFIEEFERISADESLIDISDPETAYLIRNARNSVMDSVSPSKIQPFTRENFVEQIEQGTLKDEHILDALDCIYQQDNHLFDEFELSEEEKGKIQEDLICDNVIQ